MCRASVAAFTREATAELQVLIAPATAAGLSGDIIYSGKHDNNKQHMRWSNVLALNIEYMHTRTFIVESVA